MGTKTFHAKDNELFDFQYSCDGSDFLFKPDYKKVWHGQSSQYTQAAPKGMKYATIEFRLKNTSSKEKNVTDNVKKIFRLFHGGKVYRYTDPINEQSTNYYVKKEYTQKNKKLEFKTWVNDYEDFVSVDTKISDDKTNDFFTIDPSEEITIRQYILVPDEVVKDNSRNLFIERYVQTKENRVTHGQDFMFDAKEEVIYTYENVYYKVR